MVLFISTLPAFFIVLDASVREHKWGRKVTTDERRSWYYDWLLTGGETAAELRLFGLGNHFSRAYQELRKWLRSGRLKIAQSQALGELAAGIAALGITGAAMIWMIRRAFLGLASLGDLALFYQAFNQGQGLMKSLLQNVGKIYSNSLFLGNLFEFLDLKPQIVDPADPLPAPLSLRTGIRFHNLTFRYPHSVKPALKDFNLSIPAGQIVAMVGPNGAGKSTLIKLLCRFYDPEAGKIEFDGIDLREMSIQELRRRITVLFQQPVHYNLTVRENIGLGDLKSASDVDKIKSAAEASGASELISHLPQGYSTMLGNWFTGGRELSVGEWQRIALARAFLRKAPVILLDEPTSSMDSWAETNWLERFRLLAAGRTVVLITHRFTTAMTADLICVMSEGRIVESGSHEELLASGGLYAQSWTKQMEGMGNLRHGAAEIL
jgi:ATP-binding cassette subfamily B protein